ncbi:MAG TPA: gliding motility-associated C-terminal domain-containing protein [Chitinophagaceae bacterium]|nr:MAG: PKD domain-containing protein [Bacteroidetes bacterium OLB11]HMN32108.1 gliding motility-associated C-terminal domain-containing protein [Chitinophagaceae bacterium]
MRKTQYKMKRLSILLLIFAGIFFNEQAKGQLIKGEDTLCVFNKLYLSTPDTTGTSYYWGFCSAYLDNVPSGSSIAAGTGMDSPQSICMVSDSGNYYVFVINLNNPRNLLRYDFGNSLANSPIVNNLGDFGSLIPVNSKGFEIIKEGNNWYGFIVGGATAVNSQMVRLDFGTSLVNTPAITDLGNLSGLLINPQDLFVFTEAGQWYAFTNSGFTGNLIRIDFGANITNTTPVLTNLGNPGTLSFPTGFWPVYDGSDWYLFVVNRLTQTVSRLDFGSSLLNPCVETNLGDFGGIFNNPRDIVIIKDCGNYYGYVTNEASNSLIMLTFTGAINTVPTATDLTNFSGFNAPRFLTRMFRDKDNVFCFTANNTDNTLSRIAYSSCNISSIASSTLQTPQPVEYSTPGLYNVYLAIDEGLPTMRVDCKLVRVLPKPYIEINNDTLICQQDTILLVGNGPGLNSIVWDPVYNASYPYDTTSILVYPREDYRYNAHLQFYNNKGTCAFDTSVLVRVSRVQADAGPDQFVADGAYTILGGPKLSYGQEYSYSWSPNTYLDNSFIANPRCDPRDVQFYYLTVKNDSTGCISRDTVIVRTECTDIYLPNAFNPTSDIHLNRNFGLLNNNIVHLEYFRIYNRWGQMVFETTDPAKKWDGTENNIMLPPDNYVWIVEGTCDNGKRIRKQGTVLLVR